MWTNILSLVVPKQKYRRFNGNVKWFKTMVFADDYCQVLNTLENNLYNECRMPCTNSSYKYKGMTYVINFYSEGVYYKA